MTVKELVKELEKLDAVDCNIAVHWSTNSWYWISGVSVDQDGQPIVNLTPYDGAN